MTGDYKEPESENPAITPLTILGLLTLLVLFGAMAGMVVIMLLGKMKGLEMADIISVLSEEGAQARNFVRSSALVNHLTMFVIPAILTVWFLFRKGWKDFLQIDRRPKFLNILLGSIFIISAMPLAQFAFWLNRQLPLPEWARTMEDSTNALVEGLLVANSPVEMLFNVLVIAIIPAIGEEFVFRGILQKSLARQFQKPQFAIWLAAFIFSAIHMQFEGFLARMLLGAVLGYLFYWTQNLWVPIIAHFMNNALQVVAQYFYGVEIAAADLENAENPNWMLTIASAVLLILIGRALWNYNKATIQEPKVYNKWE